MKHVVKSILFWAVIALLILFGVFLILEMNSLMFRAWLRESAVALIILAAVAGVWQLVLKIPAKWLKIVSVVLCAAATVFVFVAGSFWFNLVHCKERRGEYEGTPCIIESERALWGGTHSDFYYEDHGLFVHGSVYVHCEFTIPD